jgi:RHS repeat-associated protein
MLDAQYQFVVTTHIDESNGWADGNLSLREAVTRAQDYLVVQGGGEIPEISFAPTLAGQTIQLNSQITIASDLAIDGSGAAGLTITGGGGQRLFYVNSTSHAVTFSDLRLANVTTTWLGGAIYSLGDLTVDRVTFDNNAGGNAGGAIYAQSGSLIIRDSEFDGNSATTYAGAIRINNLTNAEIHRSTFVGNHTTSTTGATGGAIQAHYGGTLLISNSTFTENDTYYYGGAIDAFRTTNVIVENSTIVNNTVTSATGSGGILLSGGTNGDGRTLTLKNTVLSGNENNLALAHLTSGVTNPSNFNYTGTAPGLLPLGDYGGPTRTMAPTPGGPLIDTGSNAFVTAPSPIDQRGRTRIRNGGSSLTVDIGAFEYQLGTIVVNTVSDITAGPGQMTLRQAIALANASPGEDTIEFDPILFSTPQTITLADHGGTASPDPLHVKSDVKIVGPGAKLLTIAGSGGHEVFEIDGYTAGYTIDVLIDGITIRGGSAGIGVIGSELSLDAVSIEENAYGILGDYHSTIKVENSTLHHNTQSGFSATACYVTISNSTISNNGAHGVVFAESGSISLINATIAENGVYGVFFASYDEDPYQASISNSIIVGNGTDDLKFAAGLVPTGRKNLAGSVAAGSDISSIIDSEFGETISTVGLLDLSDVGGPTLTRPLASGSPAINAGNAQTAIDAGLLADQRGYARVSTTDIGAFEHQGAVPIVVNTTSDIMAGPGQMTLRQAIALANASPGADTIVFDESAFGTPQTIALADHGGTSAPDPLIISSDLQILGPGADLLKLDGGGASAVFRILAGTVDTRDLSTSNSGSGFEIEGGATTLTGVELTGHYGGGAVYAHYDYTTYFPATNTQVVTIRDSSIWGNAKGIQAITANLIVENSTISGNSHWGVLHVESHESSFTNVTITDNDSGGIIFAPAADEPYETAIYNSIVVGNGGSDLNGGEEVTASGSHNLLGTVYLPPSAAGLSSFPLGQTPTSLGLAPLDNYGGPTATHAIGTSSIAFDAGLDAAVISAGIAFDQRGSGFARRSGERVDIGAYEHKASPFLIDNVLFVDASDTGDLIVLDTNNDGFITINGVATQYLAIGLEGLEVTASSSGSTIDLSGLSPADFGALPQGVHVFGGAGDDIITGSALSERYDGRGGTDIIVGGLGGDTYVLNNTVDGQVTIDDAGGVDTLDFSGVIGEPLGGVGITLNLTSTFWGYASLPYYFWDMPGVSSGSTGLLSYSISGGPAAFENVIGTRFGDTITGNSSNNRIEGGDGENVLYGGDGDDVLMGGRSDDILIGGAGDDILHGFSGNDIFEGGTGDDILHGGVGDDTYYFAGDLSAAGNLGADTIIEAEGGGVDHLDFSLGSNSLGATGLVIDLSLFEDQPALGVAQTGALVLRGLGQAAIENVVGTSLDDVIAGNAQDNEVWGGAGNDRLYGLGGDDILHGDDGDDILVDGSGAGDVLNGGAGFDNFEVVAPVSSSSPGFDTVEDDGSYEGQYYEANGTAAGGSQHATLTWTFSNLPIDQPAFELFASWPGLTGINTTTSAQYTVTLSRNGNASPPQVVTIDQTHAPIGDMVADRPWASLGVFAAPSGSGGNVTATVTLSTQNVATNQVVLADAMRIEAFAPTSPEPASGSARVAGMVYQDNDGDGFRDLDLSSLGAADAAHFVFVIDGSSAFRALQSTATGDPVPGLALRNAVIAIQQLEAWLKRWAEENPTRTALVSLVVSDANPNGVLGDGGQSSVSGQAAFTDLSSETGLQEFGVAGASTFGVLTGGSDSDLSAILADRLANDSSGETSLADLMERVEALVTQIDDDASDVGATTLDQIAATAQRHVFVFGGDFSESPLDANSIPNVLSAANTAARLRANHHTHFYAFDLNSPTADDHTAVAILRAIDKDARRLGTAAEVAGLQRTLAAGGMGDLPDEDRRITQSNNGSSGVVTFYYTDAAGRYSASCDLADLSLTVETADAIGNAPGEQVTGWLTSDDDPVATILLSAASVAAADYGVASTLPAAGVISGYKYLDKNGNRIRDTTLIREGLDTVYVVLDVSGSTRQQFLNGKPVDDIDGDGIPNTILDAEIQSVIDLIAHLEYLNEQLPPADRIRIGVRIFGLHSLDLPAVASDYAYRSSSPYEVAILTGTPTLFQPGLITAYGDHSEILTALLHSIGTISSTQQGDWLSGDPIGQVLPSYGPATRMPEGGQAFQGHWRDGYPTSFNDYWSMADATNYGAALSGLFSSDNYYFDDNAISIGDSISVIFLSDGKPNIYSVPGEEPPINYTEAEAEADLLDSYAIPANSLRSTPDKDIRIFAYGVGGLSELEPLNVVQGSEADIIYDTTALSEAVTGFGRRSYSPDEPGIEGWVIDLYVDADGDGQLDAEEKAIAFRTTTTDADGAYRFDNLPDGTYFVSERQVRGYEQTGPDPSNLPSLLQQFNNGGQKASVVYGNGPYYTSIDYRITIEQDDHAPLVNFGNIVAPITNEAPVFTSTRIVEATVGELYKYNSTASDNELDSLTFAFLPDEVIWPAGYTPGAGEGFEFFDRDVWNDATGKVDEWGEFRWTPSATLANQNVTLIEHVTDAAGNPAQREIIVHVRPAVGNADPIIRNRPSLDHDFALRPSDPTGTTSLTGPIFANLSPGDVEDFTVTVTRPPAGVFGGSGYTPPSGEPNSLTIYNVGKHEGGATDDPAIAAEYRLLNDAFADPTGAISLKDALLYGGAGGLSDVSLSLYQPDLKNDGEVLKSSAGVFINRGSHSASGYNLPPLGVVLSSGAVRDYEDGPNDGITTSGTQYSDDDINSYDFLLDQLTGNVPLPHKDVTVLEVGFTSDSTIDLVFDVVFGSEEYPRHIGSYIDAFGLLLEDLANPGVLINLAGQPAFGPDLQHATRDSSNGIVASDVLPGTPLDSNGNAYTGTGETGPSRPVNVQHPQMTEMPGTELNAVFVPYGQSNPRLRIKAPVIAGHTYKLYFAITDTSDGVLDSTVYIANLGGGEPDLVDIGARVAGEPSATDYFIPGDAAQHVGPNEGGEVHFQLKGDGQPRQFNLEFYDVDDDEVVIATVPVSLNTDYYWDIDAYDPDEGDTLTYRLIEQPDDTATLDEATGRLYWRPTSVGKFDFKVLVEDGRGGKAEHSWTVDVQADHTNTPPVFREEEKPDPDVPLEAQVGRRFTITVNADDPNPDLEYFLVDGTFPVGEGAARMTINRNTGRIDWRPNASQLGAFEKAGGGYQDVTVRVSDRRGGFDTYTFRLEVIAQSIIVNTPPQIEFFPGTHPKPPVFVVKAGTPISVPVSVTDVNPDPVSVSVGGLQVLGYDWESGKLLGIVGDEAVGRHIVTLLADDGRRGYDTESIEIVVLPSNLAPEITSSPGASGQNQAFFYRLAATDEDDPTLYWDLPVRPAGMELRYDALGAYLHWQTPVAGDHPVKVVVSDGREKTDEQEFTLRVEVVAGPDIRGQLQTATPAHQPYLSEFTVSSGTAIANWDSTNVATRMIYLDPVSEARGMTLAFPASGQPTGGSGEAYVYAGIQIVWADPPAPGTYDVTIYAKNSTGGPVTELPYQIKVVEAVTSETNRAPEIRTKSLGTIAVDQPLLVQLVGEDKDAQTFTFELNETLTTAIGFAPGHVSSGGLISWTPTVAGPATIAIDIIDSLDKRSTAIFTIDVSQNALPKIKVAPGVDGIAVIPAATAGGYTVDFVVSDPNAGDTPVATLDAASILRGMSLQPVGGSPGVWRLTWESPVVQSSVPISITLDDGRGGVVNTGFSIESTGVEGGAVPTLDSAFAAFEEEVTIPAERLFTVNFVGIDDSGVAPLFKWRNGYAPPAGATLTSNGQLRWEPTRNQVQPAAHELEIEVVDRQGNSSPIDLSLRVVQDVSAAPLAIGSMPPTAATSLQTLIYDPVVSGGFLSGLSSQWSKIEGPQALEIDPQSGRISWTPSPDDIGKTFAVVVRVTDAIGGSIEHELRIAVAGANQAPTIVSSAINEWKEGLTLDSRLPVVDPEGHALTYEAPVKHPNGVALPQGLVVTADGRIVWDSPVEGTYAFSVRVRETHRPDSYVDMPVTLQVLEPGANLAPRFVSVPGNIQASVGSTPYENRFRIITADPDDPTGSLLELDVIAGFAVDENVELNPGPNAGEWDLVWSPSESDLGNRQVVLQLTDGSRSASRTISIDAVRNDPPSIHLNQSATVSIGGKLNYTVKASDAQWQALRFSIDPAGTAAELLESGLRIHPETGVLTWDVPNDWDLDDYSVISVIVVATDSVGASTAESVSITVTGDTIAPRVNFTLRDGATGQPVSNGQKLILNNVDGTNNDDYIFTVRVSDNVGISSATPPTLTITAPGYEPYVASITNTGGNPRDMEATYGIDVGEVGEWVFSLSATDEEGNTRTESFKFFVLGAASIARATIVSPTGNDKITGLTTIVGVADGDDQIGNSTTTTYRLELIDVATGVVAYSDTQSSVTEVNGGDLGTLDPSLIPDGIYRLRLSVLNAQDDIIALDERRVEISNALKQGDLDISFNDMSVNLGGINVSIDRRYQSTEANTLGDFGYGWNLGLLTASASFDHRTAFVSNLTQPIPVGTRIQVRLPDGSTNSFTFSAGGATYNGGGSPQFIADEGTNAVLTLNGQRRHLNLSLSYSSWGQQGYVKDNSGEQFTPAAWATDLMLTTRSGLRYHFSFETGELVGISDATGSRLDITPAKNSAGAWNSQQLIRTTDGSSSITIHRNPANGLVTSITDAAGKSIVYKYDEFDPTATPVPTFTESSDGLYLARVIDRRNDITRYTYKVGDILRLNGVYDGDRQTLTVDYNSEGRLNLLLDSAGAQAGLGYSLTLGEGRTVQHLQESVNSWIDIVKDARGNVVMRVIPLDTTAVGIAPEIQRFLVTETVYDETGSLLLRESLPYVVVGVAGRYSTPALDPGDHPEAWARRLQYDTLGRLTHSTDALGQTTITKYDDLDRVIAVIDPMGVTAHSVYDPNTGDLVERYTTNGTNPTKYNHSLYVYANGRLEETYQIATDGERVPASTVEYYAQGEAGGAVGLTKSTIDSTGQTRYFAYDVNGKQTHSWRVWTDPDNASNKITLVQVTDYDDEGNAVETRSYELTGSFTSYQSLPALSPTGFQSKTTNVLNSEGRVVESIDQFGAVTHTLYDQRGSVVETRTTAKEGLTEGWIVSRTVYDAQGRTLFVADPYFVSQADYGTSVYLNASGLRGIASEYDHLGRSTAARRLSGVGITLSVSAGDRWTTVSTDLSVATVLSTSSTHFDDFGRVEYTVGEGGDRTDYYYDAAGRQVAVLHPAIYFGGELVRPLTETVYNSAGRIDLVRSNISIAAAAHPDIYNPAVFDPEDRDDSRVQTTFYEYDAIGRQTAVVSSAVANPDHVGAADGSFDDENAFIHLRTETVYDRFGRQQAKIEGIKQADPFDVESVDRSHQLRTDYEYDNSGRLVAVILPPVDHPDPAIGEVRPRYEYGYDDYGNRITIRDNAYQIGSEVFYDHGVEDGGDFSQSFDTRVTRFTFNHLGQQTSRQLPEGVAADDASFTEHAVYDNRPLADVSGSLDESTALGQLKYSIDFDGRLTAYYYDNTEFGRGRLVRKEFFPDETAYDEGEGVASETVEYTYDGFGRTLTVTQTFTDAPDRLTTNGYDIEGRLTSVTTPEGTLRYEYDPVTGALARTYTGALDASRTSTTGDGKAITDTRYLYDSQGRLIQVASYERFDTQFLDPEVTGYTYDLVGNLSRVTLPNGVITDHEYDALNRLVKMTHYVDSNSSGSYNTGDLLRSSFEYVYDAHNRRTQTVERMNTGDVNNTTVVESQVDWAYDALGRLTTEKYDHDVSVENGDDYEAVYAFDLVGNRLVKTVDQLDAAGVDEAFAYDYDLNDRLRRERENLDADVSSSYDATTLYEYDRPGGAGVLDGTNRTATRKYSGDRTTAGGTLLSETTFEYDLRGRLKTAVVDSNGATSGGATTSIYRYDDKGIRISQTVDGVTTAYVVDKQNPTGYAQVLEEKQDLDANGFDDDEVVRNYVIGADVIAQAISGQAAAFFTADGRGGTRMLLAADGDVLLHNSVKQLFSYDAYGSLLAAPGHVSEMANAMTGLLFNGEQTDKSTGLQYLRSRYYHSHTGTFNRIDTFAGVSQIPQSLHKYLYGHGNPISNTDPSGETPLQVLFGVLIGVVFLDPLVKYLANLHDGGVSITSPLESFYVDRAFREIEKVERSMSTVDWLLGRGNFLPPRGINIQKSDDPNPDAWAYVDGSDLVLTRLALDPSLDSRLLASIIVHEYTHVTQSLFFRNAVTADWFGEGFYETPAYEAQSRFLKLAGIDGLANDLKRRPSLSSARSI